LTWDMYLIRIWVFQQVTSLIHMCHVSFICNMPHSNETCCSTQRVVRSFNLLHCAVVCCSVLKRYMEEEDQRERHTHALAHTPSLSLSHTHTHTHTHTHSHSRTHTLTHTQTHTHTHTHTPMPTYTHIYTHTHTHTRTHTWKKRTSAITRPGTNSKRTQFAATAHTHTHTYLGEEDYRVAKILS